MQDVSGFGLSLAITASNTFPSGFSVTQFADDADPLDIPSVPIGDGATGLNGDLIVWSKAAATKVTIAVINGSEDDVNLGILYQANRVRRGSVSAQDIINITAVYPNGNVTTWTSGKMTEGLPSSSVASAGRQKTKVYSFIFEGEQNAFA